MTRITCHLSMSLDGFIGGPDQSLDEPLGLGGKQLLRWHQDLDRSSEADVEARDDLMRPMGAYIMGRNMFGPIRGEWSDDWRGWWGDDPPYHVPVFVLTHYERESFEMAGGTVFHFITEGFDAALQRAREVAGDLDIAIAGGAATMRQALAAGVVDDIHLDILPVVLTRGESIFTGGDLNTLNQVSVTHSSKAIHAHYTTR